MNEPVPRFPGVYRRPDSNTYQFGLKPPKDLQHHFKGAWAVRCSLGTSDLKEANAKAKALQAEWASRFEALRRADNPERVTLNPALAATIAAELRRWVLQADDSMRDYRSGPRGLLTREQRLALLERTRTAVAASLPLKPDLSALTIAGAAATPVVTGDDAADDPLAGLPDAELGALERFNASTEAAAAIDLARRNLRAVVPLVEAVSREMGLLVDWTAPESREGLLGCLNAYRQAAADVVRRDAGEVVDTPPQSDSAGHTQPAAPEIQIAATVASAPESGALPVALVRQLRGLDVESGRKPISALFQDYFEDHREAWKHFDARVKNDYGPVRDEFIALVGDLPIERLTTKHAKAFADRIKASELAPGTKDKKLNRLAAVLRWANEKNILDDLSSPLRFQAEHRSYEKFTAEDLRALFESDAYRTNAFPAARQFWLPLLGLATGARINEVASLTMEQVTEEDGIPGLLISPGGEKTGKNRQSRRFIPFHPALIEAGLLRYVEMLRREGHSDLFPDLGTAQRDGKGKRATADFTDYRRRVGVGTKEGRSEKTFHSFRATLVSLLKGAGVSGDLRRELTGHSPTDIHGRVYEQAASPAREKLRALCAVEFPFRVPVWSDTERYRAARSVSAASTPTGRFERR